jgi:anaerobic selenocysteine-containing dehydrogenase
MLPLHQTRSMPDVLLDTGRRLAKPLSPALPWQTYEEMLAAAFGTLPRTSSAEPEQWEKAKQQGGWWSDATEAASATNPVKTAPMAMVDPTFDGAAADFPLHFLPYASQAFLDGSLAHLPWLQELPDVLSTAMWSSWVEIHPKTAAALGIAQGDLVEITSSAGTIQSPALLSPGIAPDVVAMPAGQGHENYTRYASGRGANPLAILAPMTDRETGAPAWAATRVRIAKTAGKGDLILFAGGMRERDPANPHR